MTDPAPRCEPPEGSPSGEYWVEFENKTKIVLRWRHDLAAWWFMGRGALRTKFTSRPFATSAPAAPTTPRRGRGWRPRTSGCGKR